MKVNAAFNVRDSNRPYVEEMTRIKESDLSTPPAWKVDFSDEALSIINKTKEQKKFSFNRKS